MTKKSIDSDKKTEKILIENFVALQKVLTDLSGKFDNLAHQISKLLNLFEMSAKALAEKDFEIEKNNRENMKIPEKIENVLEQNKTIARGLTLMHDKINEPKSYISPMERPPMQSMQMQQRIPMKVQSRPIIEDQKPVKLKVQEEEEPPVKFNLPGPTNEQ